MKKILLIVSMCILLLVIVFTPIGMNAVFIISNWFSPSCSFNTKKCEVTLKSDKYKIFQIEVMGKKSSLLYNSKPFTKGINNFNLCNPDTSLFNIEKKPTNSSFTKGSRYYLLITVGTSKDSINVYNAKGYKLKLDEGNWKDEMIKANLNTL